MWQYQDFVQVITTGAHKMENDSAICQNQMRLIDFSTHFKIHYESNKMTHMHSVNWNFKNKSKEKDCSNFRGNIL